MGSIIWIFVLLLLTTFVENQYLTSSLFHKLDGDNLKKTPESTSNDLDPDHDLLTSNIGIEEALNSILKR